nr:MAG: hypothetical protein [Bacteriophage sp.]
MSIKKNKLNEAAKNTGDFLSNYLGSNISQKPIEQPSQTNTDKSTEATEQANTAPQTAPRPKQKQKRQGKRDTHKLFAAWIDKSTLSRWKAYTDTKNITSEELMMCAINHYIEHEFPIEPEEQEVYKEHLEHERQLINENARGKRL